MEPLGPLSTGPLFPSPSFAGLPAAFPPGPGSPRAIITLTTDFGTDDAYVAAMKGVILDINPDATIVDICHSVGPQAVGEAAFILSTAYPYFPADTVHVVVVDPGVGGPRRAIIVETEKAIFVAPDNGVLSYVVQASATRPISRPGRTRLPPGLEAFQITNRRFWRQPVSSTFHGRDIFAPVAAHISLGKPLSDLGKPIASVNVFPLPRPERDAGGHLTGHVVHIDRFGNLITDVTADDLPSAGLRIDLAGQQIHSLSRSYEGPGGLVALVGSSGRLEISLPRGSAARHLGARVGDVLHISGQQYRRGRGRRAA